MKKIVLFGDSLFARFGKPFIEALEQILPGYDVYNCAAGGWNSNDGVKKAEYLSLLKPDVLLVSLGLNDMAPWKQIDLDTLKKNLTQIFSYFTESTIIFLLPPPINESKQTGDRKRTNSLLKQYVDAIKGVFSTTGNVSVLDSWSIYKPLLDNNKDYHMDDGVHLNEYGNSILISKLAELIESQ
jgi:lysophospholipase L1-like esterase